MAITIKTLPELRSLARQLSDMEETDFITDPELDTYLNLGVKELYDLFAECQTQEFFLKTFEIQLNPSINCYDLPDDFHVLKGVDYSQSPFPSNRIEHASGTFTTHWVMPYEVNREVYPLKPYTFHDRHRGQRGAASQVRSPASQEMKYRVFTEAQMSSSYISGGCGDVCEEPVIAGFLSNYGAYEGENGNLWTSASVGIPEGGSLEVGMCAYADFFGDNPTTLVGTLHSFELEGTSSVRIVIDSGIPWVEPEGGGGDLEPILPVTYGFCAGTEQEVIINPCPIWKHRIRLAPVQRGYLLVWYLPEHPTLTEDTCPQGLVGFHGYEEYVAIYAAIRMCRKEESDFEGLQADLDSMKKRIRSMGARDIGNPVPSQDTESSNWSDY